MTTRRSTYSPEAPYLGAGERVVWRHAPPPGALAANRTPGLVIVLIVTAGIMWVAANLVSDAISSIRGSGGVFGIMFFAMALFGVVLVAILAREAWGHIGGFLDSWSTTYALTNKRLLIISERGMVEYGPEFFARMQAIGKPGAEILMFNWGPSGKSRRDAFRDRIAGLDNAARLQTLIGETLRP